MLKDKSTLHGKKADGRWKCFVEKVFLKIMNKTQQMKYCI